MNTPFTESQTTTDSVNNHSFTPAFADSSRAKADTLVTTVKPEVHKLTGFIGKPLQPSAASQEWVSLVFLVGFLFFAYVLSHRRKMIEQTIKDFFYLKERASIFFDSTVRELKYRIYLISISVVSIAFFCYHLLYNLHTLPFSNLKIGVLAGGVLGYFLLKYFIFNLAGAVFFNKAITQTWIRSYFTVLFALGLGLFPIAIFLVYTTLISSKILVFIGFLFVVTSLVLLIYKLMQIFLGRMYSLFYLLLYLCTLEIMPVLILGKVLLKA